VEDPDAQKESGLTATDQRLLTGIFEYKDKLWVQWFFLDAGPYLTRHKGRGLACGCGWRALSGRGLTRMHRWGFWMGG
jgi:hypothetical protein